MYKIAICGKANVGKDTIARMIGGQLKGYSTLAFADPLKEMVQIAYPEIPHEWLWGASANRSNIIPGAFKEGVPLTVRQLLIDLGNDFGRAYKSDIWLRNFDHRFKNVTSSMPGFGAIVTDVRFRNEFDHLKSLGFYQVRVLRNSNAKIDDISETNQDGIENSEFDYVLHNNGTLDELSDEVKKILSTVM